MKRTLEQIADEVAPYLFTLDYEGREKKRERFIAALREAAQDKESELAKAHGDHSLTKVKLDDQLKDNAILKEQRNQLRARVAEQGADNCRLINKVNEQRAELRELEQDRARLDWLETTGSDAIKYFPTFDECYWEVSGTTKATLRAAIDAAQKGTQ